MSKLENENRLFDPDATISPSREASEDDPILTKNGQSIRLDIGKTSTEGAIGITSKEALDRAIAVSIDELNKELDRTANLSGSTYAIAEGKELGVRPKRAPAAGKGTRPKRKPRLSGRMATHIDATSGDPDLR